MKRIFRNEKFNNALCAIIAIGCFVFVWYLATLTGRLSMILPGPLVILKAFFKAFANKIGRYTLFQHIFWSLSRVLVGYGIAAVLGILLGIGMSQNKIIEAIFKPLYEMVRPIPPIAWISLAILWFGLGESMKWFIIFVSAFNNITINVYQGGKAVDQELIGVSRMLGANQKQVFMTVVIPATVPYIFAGLQVGISVSWAAVVAAEMVRSSEGLGWMVVAGMEMNDLTQVLVGVVAIGLVGFLLSILMRYVEGRVCRWRIRGV